MKFPQPPDPDATTLVKFHWWAMVIWVILIIPTLLWWRESIPWLCFMSIYAIIVGHFSGWDAARAEENNE